MIKKYVLIVMLLLAMGNDSMAQDNKLIDFDNLWNFSNPASSEEKFRNLLSSLPEDVSLDYVLQLKTQIARAEGLQRKFDDAHITLDLLKKSLNSQTRLAEIRYYLERGRVFNSSNKKDLASPLFNKSYQLAVEYNEDNLAVDAAHMVAIAEENLEKKMEWNLIAVKIAENSQQTKAYNWLGSLYNNIGWTYHDRGEYLEALHIFKKALAFREKKAEFSAIRIAKWCIARTHRSLNNIDEAIEMQLGLEKELDAVSEKDGYVYEELGELFLLKNSKDQFRKYFALAYIELSKDDWFVKNEGSRLERIKELGEIP